MNKKQAVREEDFDRAGEIKQQVDALKYQIIEMVRTFSTCF